MSRSQKAENFDTVWPLVGLGDFQGGMGRFHSPEDPRLNHFTGCAGQTVFRGDRLPKELCGNVFLPEPVGRLIRRATVEGEGWHHHRWRIRTAQMRSSSAAAIRTSVPST